MMTNKEIKQLVDRKHALRAELLQLTVDIQRTEYILNELEIINKKLNGLV